MPNDDVIKYPSGGGKIICRVRRPVRKKCAYCELDHTKLCDAPMPNGGTCDKPMCPLHATRGKTPNTDYCQEHAHLA